MNTPRASQTATLLANGLVLAVGGIDASHNPLASAELYNPATGAWTVTGIMSQARETHTATLLPNGEVLVAGGSNLGTCSATAELYSPSTGRWATTGSMTEGRCGHTATLLSNGQVLVAGGCCNSSGADLATAELYNPSTGTWQPTGSLNVSRTGAAAALLQNGEVLVPGGTNITNDTYTLLASTEAYNPAQESWQVAQTLNSSSGTPTATLLSDGAVLVLGGPAEFSDPLVHTWTNTGSYPRIAAVAGGHAATLLGTGAVLITGTRCNYSGCHVLAATSAFLYIASSNSWSVTGSMNHPRLYHTSTLLTNGKVLVTGGESGDPVTIVGTAELYTP